ncbi:hypothetical protein [Baaleninema sp.]|uniref:hypothetical protein n=1 Tax=Baaleninema sp. TaxID=3101197 RepID=UPI003CFD1388
MKAGDRNGIFVESTGFQRRFGLDRSLPHPSTQVSASYKDLPSLVESSRLRLC